MRTAHLDEARVVDDILARLTSPGGYDAFATQVRAARCCRRPVRLSGQIRRSDPAGRPEVLFDSARLPDGVLLKACGTRRETVCPPCASLYRGDAFALVAAGLRGGKGVPETVAEHPAVLLTLTAPSFGPVHRVRADGSCHRSGRRCAHEVALVCGAQHHDDELVGTPLCPACYDYRSAVLFNASVSELWRRTTIYGLRELGRLAGFTVRQAAKELRLSYVKVVEFQRRGSVHLHALVRVDRRDDEVGEPPDGIDADTLATALLLAARKVRTPVPGSDDRFGWGHEMDVQVVADVEHGRRRAAAYLAKYSTKGSDSAGILDHRLRFGVPADPRLPLHLRLLAVSAWQLSRRAELEALRLRLWAHTCGFRGHFLTKSRAYSTTFATLRTERLSWRLDQLGDTALVTDADDGVVREWSYEGSGYVRVGDAVLAEELEESARLGRLVARESDEPGATA